MSGDAETPAGTAGIPPQWALFAALDAEVLERELHHLVTPELVREHAQQPFGPHSTSLAGLLNVLRRGGGNLNGKYVVVERSGRYYLGRLCGTPGGGVDVDLIAFYPTRDQAEHAVFCRRLVELGMIGTAG